MMRPRVSKKLTAFFTKDVRGEVSEWPNETAWKAVPRKGLVSSNLTLSAKTTFYRHDPRALISAIISNSHDPNVFSKYFD